MRRQKPWRTPRTDGTGGRYRLLGSGGEDGLVLLWDVVNMSNIGAFSGNDQPVRHLSISYDSHFLAFGGDEQNVIIIQPLGTGMACPYDLQQLCFPSLPVPFLISCTSNLNFAFML